MADSNELVDFDIIEAQKENVQSLPGGRSARELARIFSGGSTTSDKYASPTPNDTRTLNDAIREEYETELQAIGESDDPLDVYDRYVKWTLNAYPSAQATAESGLLPLLERATKSFLSSTHYRNDPRYLKLWLHYIRLFSDAPRETFAFLSRHHVGEGLALFYEEFAAWLEGAGRWTQADEVYRLGVDREARPVERLLRKYSEFQQRYDQQPQNAGPSSPAMPKVRAALGVKVDPFASADGSSDPQSAARAAPAPAKTKSGKPKMAIFSDADEGAQPATSGGSTKGWENIGSIEERKKENRVEAKPWAGETLKAGKKSGPTQKMAIFRDESNPNPYEENQESSAPQHVPEHHVREAVNPRTGRRERVFVDLKAVYPDRHNPAHEISFEELRAMKRGWTNKNWRKQKEPLKQISGNAVGVESPSSKPSAHIPMEDQSEQSEHKFAITDQREQSPSLDQDGSHSGKSGKARRFKVQGETQTIKMKFDSPTNSKVRRKSTREPTMTMHTRAATDEIYDLFNQPLKAETEDASDSVFGSDYEDDDDLASNADSTVTGHLSAASSDLGDEDTHNFHRSYDDTGYADTTRAESVVDGDWTEFSVSKDIPGHEYGDATSQSVYSDGAPDQSDHGTPEKGRFVPQMPEDYAAPYGTYRDPAIMAQNRLPFMTPIVERTESSIPSQTIARNHLYNTKTPSKPQMGNLLSSPVGGATPYHGDNTMLSTADVPFSPTAFRALAPKSRRRGEVVIKDMQCNPTDKGIRNTIMNSLEPSLASYAGYHSHGKESNYTSMIQKFVRTHIRKSKGSDDAFDTPALEFPGAERNYIIRRELGAGAYAPVYLAESVDSPGACDFDENDENAPFGRDSRSKTASPYKSARYPFEAVKVENGPSSAWEFYMIRTAHDRLRHSADHLRATDSIVRAHELHVHPRESFLVEDYRGQGTLLDLVNILRNDPSSQHSEGGLEEILAMFFSVELMRTIEGLHANGILHGDIKADNCLVRLDEATPETDPASAMSLLDLNDEPSVSRDSAHYSPNGYHGWRNKGLDLIDFGRGIDMHVFQPSVQFVADWEVGTHECNEIREARPWTHQIDLYGIAGTIHVLLFGKHIESMPVQTGSGNSSSTARTYRLRESLKRYWDRELWSEVFDLLLNPGAEHWAQMERDNGAGESPSPVLPVLHSMRYVRRKMEDWLVANAEKKGLVVQLRKIETLLAERKKKLERS
ncbi:hypothetical protein N7540_012086 [Penicillium herquei]|nr:hypothetical protein N7540_012086 [Penicillium herquei]